MWVMAKEAGGFERLGMLPEILSSEDDTPYSEQIADRYAYGGGFRPFEGFELDAYRMTIKYPGDPAYSALACLVGHPSGDICILFENSWVAVVASPTDYKITRMD
jgi:hypothetical protein